MWMVLVLWAVAGVPDVLDGEPLCPRDELFDVSVRPSIMTATAGETFTFQVHVGEVGQGCYNNCYWVLAYDATLMMPLGLYQDQRDFCGHQWLSYGTLDEVWLDGDMHGWCSRLTYQEPPAMTGCMLTFDFQAIRPGVGWISLCNVMAGGDAWTEVWYEGAIVTGELVSGVVVIEGDGESGRDVPDLVQIDLLPPENVTAGSGPLELPYKVYPVEAETAPYVGIQAYITWDPAALTLLGWAPADHPWWDQSGWPLNGAGGIINETWDDGDAFLMLFDDPFDEIVPAAPQTAFKLVFAPTHSGCVRIDEWWCPPWDPTCEQAVPLVTRISDPWARSCERELDTGCVEVKVLEPQPPAPPPAPAGECDHFDAHLEPAVLSLGTGQTFCLQFHVDCPEAGRMACGYRQIDAALLYDPAVIQPTDDRGENIAECGYDWQGHIGGWEVMEGGYYVWAYNLDRPPWPPCGCAFQIEFVAVAPGLTDVSLCRDAEACTHIRDMTGADGTMELTGARVRVLGELTD